MELFFYVNDNSTAVKYSEIKDQITLDFVCTASDVVFPESFFAISGDNIVVLNDKVSEDARRNDYKSFVNFWK